MLYRWLEELKLTTTNEEFEEVLKMTSDDIRFNRIRFNKCTNAKKFIEIAEICKRLVCV